MRAPPAARLVNDTANGIGDACSCGLVQEQVRGVDVDRQRNRVALQHIAVRAWRNAHDGEYLAAIELTPRFLQRVAAQGHLHRPARVQGLDESRLSSFKSLSTTAIGTSRRISVR